MTDKLQAVHRSEVAALQEEAGLVEGQHQVELGQLREELEASHLEEIQKLTEVHRSVSSCMHVHQAGSDILSCCTASFQGSSP